MEHQHQHKKLHCEYLCSGAYALATEEEKSMFLEKYLKWIAIDSHTQE